MDSDKEKQLLSVMLSPKDLKRRVLPDSHIKSGRSTPIVSLSKDQYVKVLAQAVQLQENCLPSQPTEQMVKNSKASIKSDSSLTAKTKKIKIIHSLATPR